MIRRYLNGETHEQTSSILSQYIAGRNPVNWKHLSSQEEEKTTCDSVVAASENGRAQSRDACIRGSDRIIDSTNLAERFLGKP